MKMSKFEKREENIIINWWEKKRNSM